jgi:hypothetical protein
LLLLSVQPDTPFRDPLVTDNDTIVVETLQTASDGESRAFQAAAKASYFAAHTPTTVFGLNVLADDQKVVTQQPGICITYTRRERRGLSVNSRSTRVMR